MSDDLDHLQMVYPELVDDAMQSQEPVTDVHRWGENSVTYRAAQYDPETERVWRADIGVDEHPQSESAPTVSFERCFPTADHEFLQKWTALATGRLSGPQHLPEWEALFTVFNAALGLYREETGEEAVA